MPTITAAEVNKLRQQTGAGMMDCRKALVESDGDMEKAIDYLRKKGAKVAALRSDREAREGVVIARTSADRKTGVILLLSCETDFVAKNQDFVQFAQDLASTALESGAGDSARLDEAPFRGATVKDRILDQVGRIGEKIAVARLERLQADTVVAYNHAGNRVAVLVGLNQAPSPATESAGRDLAMQIAAMNPIAVDQAGIPETVIEREKAIYVEQIRAEGKPAEIAEKIALGKLNKFFKDSTLLGQAFVKDGDQTVAGFLKSVDPGLKVTAFKRVALGA
ncbi:MAG TPA: translation elongation factor Ts [Chitinophagaceae bacterium]|nr:translation elongation factor Ts [Chitinophagaceae bacterium]